MRWTTPMTSAAINTRSTIGRSSIADAKPSVTPLCVALSCELSGDGSDELICAKIRIPISPTTPMTTTLMIVPTCPAWRSGPADGSTSGAHRFRAVAAAVLRVLVMLISVTSGHPHALDHADDERRNEHEEHDRHEFHRRGEAVGDAGRGCGQCRVVDRREGFGNLREDQDADQCDDADDDDTDYRADLAGFAEWPRRRVNVGGPVVFGDAGEREKHRHNAAELFGDL